MIGPRLRLLLRVAAFGLMILGALAGLTEVYETLSNENLHIPGNPLTYGLYLIANILRPVVTGGVLLLLIEIDQRLERKAAS